MGLNPSLENTKPVTAKKARAKKVTRITVPMLNQMLEAGTFYGNESHFRRRHSKVVKWLETIRDKRLRTGAK